MSLPLPWAASASSLVVKHLLTPGGPMPEALMQAFSVASDDFLGAEWHVVFKGKRPGVYLAWLVTFILLLITCV
jgi:hypothetical protein